MSTYRHEVTSHHDGHGLAESIRVYAKDEPGPGGASHRYEFYVEADGALEPVGYLQFQRGPRNDPESTKGVLTVAVLAALIDIQDAFDSGPYPSEDGKRAGDALRDALGWLHKRADERAERGVLGVNAK